MIWGPTNPPRAGSPELSPRELFHLTLFKWRYMADQAARAMVGREDPDLARRLVFGRFLARSGRLREDG